MRGGVCVPGQTGPSLMSWPTKLQAPTSSSVSAGCRPRVLGRHHAILPRAAVAGLERVAVPAAPPAVPPVASRNTAVSERYRAFLDAWDKGFTFNHTEQPVGEWLTLLEGALPTDLGGTYFRNGPGQFSMGAEEYGHPYDGDGLICSVAFRDGRAFFRSRFIRTPEFELETAEQRVLFRGSFAAQRAGGQMANLMNLVIKNNSNVNVVEWGGRLLTMFEATVPYVVDPATLATRGPELLGGRIAAGIPVELGSASANRGFGTFQRLLGSNSQLPEALTSAGGHAFTAHPHVDSNTGRMCLWTYQMFPRGGLSMMQDTRITFRELEPSVGHPAGTSAAAAASLPLQPLSIVVERSFDVDGFGFLHDFAVTRNYYVLVQAPVETDTLPYMAGTTCAASTVRWRKGGDPTLVHVIPRPGSEAERRGEAVRSLPISPATFVFHHCNAYESGDVGGGATTLTLDSIHYDALPGIGRQAIAEAELDPDAGFRASLRRLTIDLAGPGAVAVSPPCSSRYLELPSVSGAVYGQRSRYIYAYSSNFEEACIGIAKVDMDTGRTTVWEPQPRFMCLEPTFVPRPSPVSEDDGYLLFYGFDTDAMRSELLVLDALHLENGPLARLGLPVPLPHGLHGSFSNHFYGPLSQPA